MSFSGFFFSGFFFGFFFSGFFSGFFFRVFFSRKKSLTFPISFSHSLPRSSPLPPPSPPNAKRRERFAGEAQEHYGVDVTCLTRAYREEQALYYSKTAAWADVDPGDLLGGGQVVASMDLGEIGLEESKRPLEARVDLLIEGEGPGGDEDATTTCDAIVGYFDVSFRGGKAKTSSPSSSSSAEPSPTGAPATEPVVTLSTEPCAEGATHWGQQVFPLCPPLPVKAGDRVRGSVVVRRRKDNPRLLEVELDVRVVEGPRKGAVAADGALNGVRKERYQVE